MTRPADSDVVDFDQDYQRTESPDGARQPLARAPRIALRVSGARLGDAVRPAPSTIEVVGPRKRFGLKVNNVRLGARQGAIAAAQPDVLAESDEVGR